MLSYIEELLSRPQELENLHIIANRNKLQLFPRILTYSKRQRLRRLFTGLANAQSEEEKNDYLAKYKGQKEEIMTKDKDYDVIIPNQAQKYEKITINSLTSLAHLPQE